MRKTRRMYAWSSDLRMQIVVRLREIKALILGFLLKAVLIESVRATCIPLSIM